MNWLLMFRIFGDIAAGVGTYCALTGLPVGAAIAIGPAAFLIPG